MNEIGEGMIVSVVVTGKVRNLNTIFFDIYELTESEPEVQNLFQKTIILRNFFLSASKRIRQHFLFNYEGFWYLLFLRNCKKPD